MNIESLQGLYIGQTCWVVGSGPSIRHLERSHFGDGPVIAINYAIEMVEPLNLENDVYSMQKDRCFVKPQRAALLVHDAESRRCFGGYEPQYTFSMAGFGLASNRPSDNACVAMADWFWCSRVVFLCCDASATGDIRKYNKEQGIYQRRYRPENLLRHRAMIEEVASKFDMPIEFRTPGEP